MNRKLYSVLAITALGLLSACSPSAAPKPGEKPLTQARAAELRVVAPELGKLVVNSLRNGGRTSAQSIQGQSIISGECSISAFTDQDNDKIPLNYTATFRDCLENKLLFVQKTNGSININDADDTNKDSGFTSRGVGLRFDFYTAGSDGKDADRFFTIRSDWDVTVAVSASQATVDYSASLGLTSYKSGQTDKTWNGSLNFDGAYVPANDGDLDNLDAGTINFRGELVLGDYALNGNITNLVFNESCATPISGTIRFDDGALGNSAQIVYTACNTYTFTYTGSSGGQ